MYRNLLPYLQCARCNHTPLVLVAGREADGEVLEGGVRCEQCGHVSPITDGILDVLGDAPVPSTPAQLTNYAPPAAWGYERLWRWQALSLMSGQRFPLTEELRLVRALVAPERGGLALDVACSTGLYARAFATSAPAAVIAAVDHSRAMLREAQHYARRGGYTISFVRASAQALPFRTASTTSYGMGGSLNELGDIDAALREVRRVLDPRGRFVSMNLVQAQSRLGQLIQHNLSHGGIEFPPQGQLNQRFVEAGLQLKAQWRWRVVTISQLLPREGVAFASNPTIISSTKIVPGDGQEA